MLRTLYTKYIRSRLFNKLMLLYAAIILFMVSMLTYIISGDIAALLKKQAIDYNKQVLQTVNQFFYEKNAGFKKNLQQVCDSSFEYNNNVISSIVRYLLNDGYTAQSYDSISSKSYLDKFIYNLALPSDYEIKDIFFMNRPLDFYFNYSRNYPKEETLSCYDEIKDHISGSNIKDINAKKTYMVPAFKARYKNPGHFFAIYDYVRNSGSPGFSGYMAYVYDCDSIKDSYQLFHEYLIGHILVLTSDGRVIYDSSGQFYEDFFPYFKDMGNSYGGTFSTEDSIINYSLNSSYDFITVGILPNHELYKKIHSVIGKIYITASICILCIILLSLLTTKAFTKRIKTVLHSIKKIQRGDFSTRIKITGNGDEIEQFSQNINLMSEKLDEYIKKEYISVLQQKNAELNQKTAELYVLQSQINPHFLYNTLEAIRMKALSTGDTDISQMIMILSRLFRSSIKGEMIISVRDEISYCKHYLELHHIRFGEHLKVEYEIEPSILDYAILKHSLQPIIENSIVHGINNETNNKIKLKGIKQEEHILISVSDNGSGIPEEKLQSILSALNQPLTHFVDKIGIFNVNSRIRLIYGNDCGLTIKSQKDRGTEVVMKIKAMSKEDLQKNVQGINR